jgi:3-dehydroquinate dehydratase / shikimate dehydrogenase
LTLEPAETTDVDKPLLCVTVTAPTMAELRVRRDEVAEADLVELRLDTTRDPDALGALEGRRRPVIVTCRAGWEGGGFRGSEEERLRILQTALDAGAEYVDVEFKAEAARLLASTAGKRVIVSSHDFERLPMDIEDRARAMRATGAEAVKIAAKTDRLSDAVTLLDLSRTAALRNGKSIIIGMGPAGLVTRVLAARFGSAWTYAGGVRDVGQISAATLLDDFHFRRLSNDTALYGLTGSPISHSVSPGMHNAAIEAAGLDAVYLPLPATDADDFMRFARAFDLQGASVTIPFKVSLRERLDDVDDLATAIGAINTIRQVDGRWLGRNTDVAGFLQPLIDRRVPLAGLRVSILGAGGAARAAALALGSRGAMVSLHARDRARASQVAGEVGVAVGTFPPPAGCWDLLVNCTPVGMHPRVDATPLAAELLSGGLVYDLIYNPTETRLLTEAAAAGCDTIGGLDMLVGQAVEQFEWWTGIRPSPDTMRAAALARLAEFRTDENHVV